MLFVLMLAGVVGGLITAALAFFFGWLAALIAAPIGGSTVALLVVSYLAHRRSTKLKAVQVSEESTPYSQAA